MILRDAWIYWAAAAILWPWGKKHERKAERITDTLACYLWTTEINSAAQATVCINI